MKLLPANNTSLPIMVDDEDFERLSQFKWTIGAGNGVHRTVNGRGFSKRIALANEILRKARSIMIDHKDRNPLNNQKSNLRECTRSQNTMNSRKRRNSSSKYKGVSWHKASKKWYSRIRLNGKLHVLGLFINEVDAAKRYDVEATRLFGEFAHVNSYDT